MTSIDWPLWEDTGMRIPESKRQHLHAQTGFLPIPVGTAVQTLEHCLATAEPHIIVGYGETSRVKATVEGSFVCKRDDRQADTPLPNTPVSRSVMKRTVLQYLRSLLAEEIKLPEERIDASCSLGRYGVDSVIIMSMNASLETHIPSLPKSLFYEHDSLDELAEYFVTNHPRWITRHFGLEDRTAVAGTETSPEQETHGLGTPRASGGPADIAQERTQDANGGNDIAIIGVSGRYPMANDLHEFWGNLKEGKDCIREIPPERWHGWDYYSAHKGKVGKSYSVWGGFIDDVDKFDSLFFRISPDEAMLMDPQERIFLETAWHTVEDAGYRVDSVAKAKVGVFVGVMWGQYQFFGVEGMAKGKYVFPSSSFSSIANRVSFCLNFRGPSLAVDTMCSSSLTALHLACESLRRGESEYALVGGVNLSLHPFKYLALGDSGLLSTNGQCRAFGKDGDGYVPGEGVGSVLLKPLWKSIEDNDNIYAVIKATAVNHGGQTSGYTVPSPNAQAALISEALQGAGIDPGSIGYVEAHGAGTALGDPIEIAGLQKSLGKGLQNLVCPIGSVKTNIGHLEAAAGIAGLTKVLLQLQHKQLVPSLHAQQLNPNIDFASVPFRVQQVLETFTAPSATEGKEPSPPRRACISSFGAGGANAHVIVEEYERRGRRSMPTGSSSEGLILLSAKSKEQLIKYAARLRSYVRAACEPADSDGGASGQVRKQCADQDLASIAYTLQAGRMPMEHRVAIVAEDLRELLDKLNGFCEQIPDARDVYQGNVTEEKNRLKGLVDGTEGDEFARLLLRSRNIRKLAELWVAGVDLDWDLLYPDRRPRRLSLPTYPFAKVSHWLCREGGTTPGREGEVSTVPRVRHEEHRGPEPAKRRATGEEGERTLAALEEAITGKIARLLKMDREQIDVGTAVSALGFSSIYALRLLNLVNDEYGQQIALKEVAFSPYLAIRDLTRAIARLVTGRRDDHSVAPNGARHTHGRRVEVTYRYDDLFPEVQDLSSSLTTHSILLTGATGILGGRLLKDLLETTKSDVFCLIRDVSLEAARIRAKAMLRVHDPQGRLEREFDTRVRPILGDISADELGLSPHHRAELADRIDLVLHCAAKASLTGRYEEVAATNVDGTAHIAEFALQTRQRYCVLISTHMVMGDRWMKDCAPFAERDLMLGQSFEDMGYQRSKYEAEIITRLSHREGLRWVIVRSGNIMGDSTSGYYPVAVNNVESFFYDMIRTIIQTQYAVETPLYFDITPIDYVSKGILHLCLERRHVYETYHLTNPHHRRTSDVYDLIRQCGYEFTVLDHASYAEAIRKISNDLDTESSILLELTRFNPLFRNRPTGSSYADNQYTTKLLEAAEITCHEVDYELMKVYLDYCTEIGYIGRPGTVS